LILLYSNSPKSQNKNPALSTIKREIWRKKTKKNLRIIYQKYSFIIHIKIKKSKKNPPGVLHSKEQAAKNNVFYIKGYLVLGGKTALLFNH